MARHKLVNGIKVEFTAAEETARDEAEAQALINQQDRATVIAAAEAKQASGKQKLKDLGLDDDEIKALTGK
jgi:hypothetical protein